MTLATHRKLLIVAHQPSPNTGLLARAALAAAKDPALDSVCSRLLLPGEASADDVLGCDALLLGTTENFGYMAGALKDFFERIYYPCLERTQGKPYALWVRAGQDGLGAQASVERIITGLGWRVVQPALILRGQWQGEYIDQVRELSLTVAAGVDAGIY